MTCLFNSSAISVYGFYGHAGNAYASKSLSEASRFLGAEVDAVNTAAQLALDLLNGPLKRGPPSQPFILSVGSTPTAHAASAETRSTLSKLLHGSLELHAGEPVRLEWNQDQIKIRLGNYPVMDLQQEYTGMIDQSRIAQFVQATVVSLYPGRGAGGTDEAIIDAGAIAFSKDTGPSGDFGKVLGTNWRLGRMSQEHGILTIGATRTESDSLKVGDLVEVVGQHACLIAAAYPWYYIVDTSVEGGRQIVDMWVPWKGW
jgi:D-serine deaminase-like pyridoxal phosphate-dependent protein